MRRVFVTATGTGVGKTFVMCRLVEELRSAGGWRSAEEWRLKPLPRTGGHGRPARLRVLKPVVTGFDARDAGASDPGRLLRSQGSPSSRAHLDATSPWRFAAPLSPDMAARREDRVIPFDELIAFCTQDVQAELTLIEGIGGVMVPLDEQHTVLDWIERLAPQVLLVAGSYLGTLSHTLTAAAALGGRGVTPAAVIVSESAHAPVALAETTATLQRLLPGTRVVGLPREPTSSVEPPPLLPLLEGVIAT